MYHLERNKSLRAVLCEKSDKVFRAWQFLKTATEKDIDDYPIPKAGDRTSDFFAMASSASNAFCDRVDGCIVAESEINNYTKVGLECSRKRGLKKS